MRYLEQGGTKARKAYTFLEEIEKSQKNSNEAERYFDMKNRIRTMFISGFAYMSAKNCDKKVKKGWKRIRTINTIWLK